MILRPVPPTGAGLARICDEPPSKVLLTVYVPDLSGVSIYGRAMVRSPLLPLMGIIDKKLEKRTSLISPMGIIERCWCFVYINQLVVCVAGFKIYSSAL